MGYRLIDNDNIKEILDNIKNKYEDYYVQDIVSGNDLKLLLSYIEQLEEELKYSIGIVQHNQIVTKLSKEKKQLENNRDKAIDFIENNDEEWFSTIELISILKGDSDE